MKSLERICIIIRHIRLALVKGQRRLETRRQNSWIIHPITATCASHDDFPLRLNSKM